MYETLIKEMALRSVTKEAVANLLSISRDTVRAKCKGKARFYYDEAVRIRETFFPDLAIEALFDTAEIQEFKKSRALTESINREANETTQTADGIALTEEREANEGLTA
jgi:plasmid maintenance system antidote protein VapI